MPSGSASAEASSARPLLFTPLKIREMELKNRLVVPPMVHYRSGPGQTMTDWHLVHLGRYAWVQLQEVGDIGPTSDLFVTLLELESEDSA